MEPKDLVKIWEAPDNSQLTPKQISIRLPIHVAAKIGALSELYPRKTKTEIIGDLLAAALDQLQLGLYDGPDDAPFDEGSLGARYCDLVKKHSRELERESGLLQPDTVETKPSKRDKRKRLSK